MGFIKNAYFPYALQCFCASEFQKISENLKNSRWTLQKRRALGKTTRICNLSYGGNAWKHYEFMMFSEIHTKNDGLKAESMK